MTASSGLLSVIAAVADGWWYSLGNDSGNRLVGRIGDHAPAGSSSWAGLPDGIAALLDRAEARPGTRRVAANSAWLEQFAACAQAQARARRPGGSDRAGPSSKKVRTALDLAGLGSCFRAVAGLGRRRL